MNTLTLSGNLTEDPKLEFADDVAVCVMRLAVDNGRYATTYIDIKTFGEQAYVCAEYLVKGRKVGVSGRLAYEEWRTLDDEKRWRYSVIGNVEFLDRPPGVGVVPEGEGPGTRMTV